MIRDYFEDRGISPVIGVILMVVVTVVMAAVIFNFVIGVGDNVDTSQGSDIAVNFEQQEDSVRATLNKAGTSGEIRVNGTRVANFSAGDAGRTYPLTNLNEDSVVSVIRNDSGDATQLYSPVSEVGNPADAAKVKNKGGSSTVKETFENKDVSQVNTFVLNGSPDFEVVSRLGSDWGAVNLNRTDTDIGGYSVKDPIKDGVVRFDANDSSYKPLVFVVNSDGSKYVQFRIRNESDMVISYNYGNGSNLVSKDNVVSSFDLNESYKIDYNIDEGNSMTFDLETSTGISETLTYSDAPTGVDNRTVVAAVPRSGEVGVFIDYIK